jgi:hypothetical protein
MKNKLAIWDVLKRKYLVLKIKKIVRHILYFSHRKKFGFSQNSRTYIKCPNVFAKIFVEFFGN